MATYTITGHPLNYSALGLTQIETDLLRYLENFGVGQQFTITLAGPADTKVKGHGILR